MDLQQIANACALISDAFTMLAQGLESTKPQAAPVSSPAAGSEKPEPAPKAKKEKPAQAPEPTPEPEPDFMAGLESPPTGYPAKTKADVISAYHKAVEAHGAPKVNPVVTKVISSLGFQKISEVPEDQMGELFAKFQEALNA
jgi:hypothetical protein